MYTTFVLGAGFSRAAGLPLANELLPLVRQRAEVRGSSSIIDRDLERYLRYHERIGEPLPEGAVLIEDLMSFLDIEHFLGLMGSDTLTEQGNRGQLLVRNLLAETLWERQEAASDAQLAPYRAFVDRLDLTDWVYTFNNDTLLERCLDDAQKPYRLFPFRFQSVSNGGGSVADEAEVTLIKLHGSLDWFSIDPWLHGLGFALENSFFYLPRGSVFDDYLSLDLSKLVQGPRLRDDPLVSIYRMRNVGDYLATHSLAMEAPILAAPSYHKQLYLGPLRELWNGFGRASYMCPDLVIIGFSLSPHDEYVRQALFNLVTGFQSYDRCADGSPKPHMRMVDLQPTPEGQAQYRQAFAFADWSKTDCRFDGFGLDAIEFVFGHGSTLSGP